MEINERIKKRRKDLNLTLKDVAKELDVSESLISRYESKDVKNMGVDKIAPLAKVLKCSPSYLMGWEEKSNVTLLDQSQFISVPVYGKASAGCGYINMEKVLYNKVIPINGYSHDSFLIEVSGDSMEPTILDGEFVLVDPTDFEVQNGKIYIVTFNNETFIKKIENHGDIILLKSINPEYEDKMIRNSEFDFLKIEGRVVKVISERNL